MARLPTTGADWVDLPLPVGGFGTGGGWKYRAHSTELTPYQIHCSTHTVRRRDGQYGDGGVIASHLVDRNRKDGYRRIKLSVAGAVKSFFVHSLVCWCAHGPSPTHCSSVDHRDQDPSNNSADNLRWATTKEQAANRGELKRRAAGSAPGPEAGTKLFRYLGSPGFAYTGPLLDFSEDGKVYRDGKLGRADSVDKTGYPQIYVKGLGSSNRTHRIAWSAYHGPDAPIPEVINHKDGNKRNFALDNLEESNASHNAFAAHDIGAHAEGKRQRRKVVIHLLEKPNEDWLFDGTNPAVFESLHHAKRALKAAGACTLKNIQANISRSMAKGSFGVVINNKPAKAFAKAI